MTQRTQSAAPVNATSTLEATRLYQQATAQHQRWLALDMSQCLADGLPEAEYLEALEEWGGTVAEYLAEQGGEQDTVLEEECAQPDPDDAGRAAAEALVEEAKAREQAAQDRVPVLPPCPTAGEMGQLVADINAAAEVLAQRQEQAAEQEARERAAIQAAVKSMVQAYTRGERAYRRGLLDAGGHAHTVVRGKLRVGDKRKAAVQLVEGVLALHSSDSVDANRLIRCWAAWQLLAVEQGLEKTAEAVPYGHYRDAWAKCVERVQPDTGEEHYVLLVGLEQECRVAFSQALEAGLSKDACQERCQVLVREQGVRAEQVAKKAAHTAAQAKAQADTEALALAKAQRQAEEQARAAEVKAQEALAAEVQDEERVSQALEQAQAASQAAEQARKQREAADHAAQQRAREEARAKQEATEASRKQAEADAKAQVKAARKAAKQGDEQPATVKQPAQESRAGQNLLATAKAGTAKDAGHMAAAIVRDHPEPLDVLRSLVLDLLDSPPKGVTPEEVAQASLRALGKFRQDMDPATQRALNAALLSLSKGNATPAQQPATAAESEAA